MYIFYITFRKVVMRAFSTFQPMTRTIDEFFKYLSAIIIFKLYDKVQVYFTLKLYFYQFLAVKKYILRRGSTVLDAYNRMLRITIVYNEFDNVIFILLMISHS